MGIGALAALTVALVGSWQLAAGSWQPVARADQSELTLRAAPPARLETRDLQQAATSLLPAEEDAQIKLGEEPADPEKDKAAAVARAKTYLGKKLGVAPEKLVLASAKPATWPDAALGCPEKDRMYAQVLTDGYKVILKLDGKKHEVHVSRSRAISCEPRS